MIIPQMNSLICLPLVIMSALILGYSQKTKLRDKEIEGLYGPVHTVHTQSIKVSIKGKDMKLDKPVVLENSKYSLEGDRISTNYYPNPNAILISGRELYKYDKRGNIIEMTLLSDNGSIVNKETYDYEYDSYGNWTKMTTSVATITDGKLAFEVSEIIERTITYYNVPVNTTPSVTAQVSIPNQSTTTLSSNTNRSLPAVVMSSSVPNDPVLNSPIVVNSESSTKASIPLSFDTPPNIKTMPPNYRLIYKEGVLKSKAVYLPLPVYPMAARTLQTGSSVSVEVIIDTTGRVISAHVIKGHKLFHQSALDAALKARFTPTTIADIPVKVTGVINYDFGK